MNFCTKCGKPRLENAKFCIYCGSKLTGGQQMPAAAPSGAGGYKQPSDYPVDPATFLYGNIKKDRNDGTKPKRTLYDKLYRNFWGSLMLSMAGLALFSVSMLLSFTQFMEESPATAILIWIGSTVLIVAIIVTPIIVKHRRLMRSAAKTEQVVLRSKEQLEVYMRGSRKHGRGYMIRQYLVFMLPDGSEKTFLLRGQNMRANGLFDLSLAGDTGTLIYKERERSAVLIDFKNDSYRNELHDKQQKRSVYDWLHNTNLGLLLKTLVSLFSIISLIFGIVFSFACLFDSNHAGYSAGMIVLLVMAIAVPAAVLSYLHIPPLLVRARLKHKPENMRDMEKEVQGREQKVRVRLIDKGLYEIYASVGMNRRHALVFEFPDSSRKCFRVHDVDVYDRALVGDTGVLAYREHKGESRFISFERDR